MNRSNKFHVVNPTESRLEVEEVNTVGVVQEIVEITIAWGAAKSGRALHQQGGAVTGAISDFANRFAAAHIDSCPFSPTSKASQVGFAAWFVSAPLYCCFCKMCEQ